MVFTLIQVLTVSILTETADTARIQALTEIKILRITAGISLTIGRMITTHGGDFTPCRR